MNMVLAFFQARMWLVWGGVAAVVYGAGVWSGMSVQHLREASARESLLKEISTLQASQIASERASADAALSQAETAYRLSAASLERFTGVLAAQSRSDDNFRRFLEESRNAEDGDCRCLVPDIDRDRWMRLDTGDGVRDAAGPDSAGDE